MEVILRGLATSNDLYGLQFTTSPWRVILNKFIIRRRKPCQLPDWMKNASYYSPTVGIRTLYTSLLTAIYVSVGS